MGCSEKHKKIKKRRRSPKRNSHKPVCSTTRPPSTHMAAGCTGGPGPHVWPPAPTPCVPQQCRPCGAAGSCTMCASAVPEPRLTASPRAPRGIQACRPPSSHDRHVRIHSAWRLWREADTRLSQQMRSTVIYCYFLKGFLWGYFCAFFFLGNLQLRVTGKLSFWRKAVTQWRIKTAKSTELFLLKKNQNKTFLASEK